MSIRKEGIVESKCKDLVPHAFHCLPLLPSLGPLALCTQSCPSSSRPADLPVVFSLGALPNLEVSGSADICVSSVYVPPEPTIMQDA